MLRVAVVADDALVRAGLIALLEAEPLIVPLPVSGADATPESLRSLGADVLLWARDSEQPLPFDQDTPVVLLLPRDAEREYRPSIDDDAAPGRRDIEDWPVSIISRGASSSQLAAALAAAAAGLVVSQAEFAYRPLPEELRPGGGPGRSGPRDSDLPLEPLSARELEVLRLLADGLSNKAISKRLEVSEHTVKFHLNSLFDKLAVHNRTEAVSRAVRLGLIAL